MNNGSDSRSLINARTSLLSHQTKQAKKILFSSLRLAFKLIASGGDQNMDYDVVNFGI